MKTHQNRCIRIITLPENPVKFHFLQAAHQTINGLRVWLTKGNEAGFPDKGHVLIGGTGRAGTTLLVQLFTYLGFDTGFTLEQAQTDIDPISRGGLERRLFEENLPEVIKSPYLCHDLSPALASGFPVKAAIVPVRDLFEAAESRRSISNHARMTGGNWRHCAGGLWDVQDPSDQEARLAVNFYNFLQPLIKNDIPIILIAFPRFVHDAAYLYDKLRPLFSARGISFARVKRAYAALVREDLVGNSSRIARQGARVPANT